MVVCFRTSSETFLREKFQKFKHVDALPACLVFLSQAHVFVGGHGHKRRHPNPHPSQPQTSEQPIHFVNIHSNIMVHPSTHLAAILVLLVGTQDGVHSQYHHASRGGHGRNRFNAWPSAFMSNDLDGGAFRPFHAYPRGGGVFTSGAPLVDVFQEVIGDIKKGTRKSL